MTWCHRVLKEGESDLNVFERLLLGLINRAYYLPQWVSIARYADLCDQVGLSETKVDDWAEKVAPFWTAVLRTALTINGVKGLLKAGLKTMRGAAVMPLMRLGFATGTIKFNLLTAVKK